MAADLPEITPRRRALATALRGLREAAGIDQRELARRAGWSQAKVSRLENGRTVPAMADVEAWARATGAGEDTRAGLVEAAEAVATEATSWRVLLGQGFGRKQQAVAELERAARAVYHFQPAIIPGLLQTAEYARRILSLWKPDADPAEIAHAVRRRLERQHVLHDPAREWQFLVTEAALRFRPGPAEVLRAQLVHVQSLATLANIRLGVLPMSAAAPAVYLNGFIFYDADDQDAALVTVETFTAELQVHDPAGIAAYRDVLDRLREAALWDDKAIALLGQIVAEA